MEKAVRRLISEEKISLNFSEKILSSDFFDPFSVKIKSACGSLHADFYRWTKTPSRVPAGIWR